MSRNIIQSYRLPIELINKILVMRPTHDLAKLFMQTNKEYRDEYNLRNDNDEFNYLTFLDFNSIAKEKKELRMLNNKRYKYENEDSKDDYAYYFLTYVYKYEFDLCIDQIDHLRHKRYNYYN